MDVRSCLWGFQRFIDEVWIDIHSCPMAFQSKIGSLKCHFRQPLEGISVCDAHSPWPDSSRFPECFMKRLRLMAPLGWQLFSRITLPSLKKMLVVALALDIVWEVRRFGLIQAMTQGGPGNITEVLSTYIYKQYFQFFRFEYASAVAVVMTIALLMVSLPYIWMISQEE